MPCIDLANHRSTGMTARVTCTPDGVELISEYTLDPGDEISWCHDPDQSTRSAGAMNLKGCMRSAGAVNPKGCMRSAGAVNPKGCMRSAGAAAMAGATTLRPTIWMYSSGTASLMRPL
jgi:hypothetical protein